MGIHVRASRRRRPRESVRQVGPVLRQIDPSGQITRKSSRAIAARGPFPSDLGGIASISWACKNSSPPSLERKAPHPDEAKSMYERENQELATEAVFFSASNHLDTVRSLRRPSP